MGWNGMEWNRIIRNKLK